MALQVVAAKPVAVGRDDVPAHVVDEQRRIFVAQVANQMADKPEQIREKIATGKLDAWFRENTLLDQEFVKDPSKKVQRHPGGGGQGCGREAVRPLRRGRDRAGWRSLSARDVSVAARVSGPPELWLGSEHESDGDGASPAPATRGLIPWKRARSWVHPSFAACCSSSRARASAGPGEGGINVEEVSRIARQASRVASRGVGLAIVVGGGNILRGATLTRGQDVIQESTAHYMGMMATVINGLALQDALEGLGCQTRLMTTIRMEEVAEPFIRRRALSHLDKGRVIILATGTGGPFVTTDTAAAMRGKELGVDVDPEGHPRRRHLLGRPREEPARPALRATDLRPDPARRAQGHGPDGRRHVPGEQAADPGVQLQEGR